MTAPRKIFVTCPPVGEDPPQIKVVWQNEISQINPDYRGPQVVVRLKDTDETSLELGLVLNHGPEPEDCKTWEFSTTLPLNTVLERAAFSLEGFQHRTTEEGLQAVLAEAIEVAIAEMGVLIFSIEDGEGVKARLEIGNLAAEVYIDGKMTRRCLNFPRS